MGTAPAGEAGGGGGRALKYFMGPAGPCPQERLFLPSSFTHTLPLFPGPDQKVPSSYGLNSFIGDKTLYSTTTEERLENANTC